MLTPTVGNKSSFNLKNLRQMVLNIQKLGILDIWRKTICTAKTTAHDIIATCTATSG
jgi:hypothetical protein